MQGLLQRSMQQPGTIQRLMTSGELIALAGAPHADKKIGFGKLSYIKRMSGKYKNVLDAMSLYHGELNLFIDREKGGEQTNSLIHRLDVVEEACEHYERHHKGDTRTQHISKIKAEAIQERNELNAMKPNIAAQAGKTFVQALAEYRKGIQIQKIENEAFNQIEKVQFPAAIKEKLVNLKQGEDQAIKELNPEAEVRKPEAIKAEATKETNTLLTDNEKLTDRTLHEVGSQIGSATDTSGGREGGTNYAQSFRGNTLATALLSTYSYQFGKTYLRTSVLPALRSVLKHEGSLEVNPEKDPEANIEENVNTVKGFYTELMNVFIGEGAVGRVPLEIKQMAYTSYVAFIKKGASPDDALQFVASMIFLRFINPLIASLAAKAGGDSSRTLLLLSKVLQNQANNVQFGAKEQFMMPFNSLMTEYNEGMGTFLQGVVEAGRTE